MRQPFLFAIMLVLAVLVIYGQTAGFAFVFDDIIFISNNRFITDPARVGAFFHEASFPLSRFLTLMTFSFNHALYGMNPSGYHKFNILLHIAAVFAVWWLARILFIEQAGRFAVSPLRAAWQAFLVALLFAVHPVQTQAVAYVTQRFALLCTLFYVLAVACYIKARTAALPRDRRVFTWLTVLTSLVALMAKEDALFLPLMFLACEYIFLSGAAAVRRRFLPVILGGLVFLIFSWTQFRGLGGVGWSAASESHDGDILTLGTYLLTQVKVFWIYVKLFFCPAGQRLDYDLPMARTIVDRAVLAGLAGMACVIAFWAHCRRSMPLVALGLAWVLVTFLTSLFPRAHVIWEHRMYLLSTGFIVACVAWAGTWRVPGKVLVVAGLVVAALLAGTAFIRTGVWRSELTLWADNAAKTPDKFRPNLNLAVALVKAGRGDQAFAVYQKIERLRPFEVKVLLGMGDHYLRQGRYDQARDYYEKALIAAAGNSTVYQRLIALAVQRQDMDEAVTVADRLVKQLPDETTSYTWRAFVEESAGRMERAKADLQKALILDRYNWDAILALGNWHYLSGNNDEAFKQYDRVTREAPMNMRGHLSKAQLYYNVGDMAKARREYLKARSLDPYSPDLGVLAGLLTSK